MATKKTDEIIFFRNLPKGRKKWGMFCTIGIFLVILGCLAVGFASWATEFTVILLGFFLAGAGILQIINSYHSKKWTGFSYSLLVGILYLLAGGLCIFKPIASAVGLTLLIGIVLVVGGIFRLVSALSHRFTYWKWMVFSGIISILLGFLILIEWPSSSIWVIGLFIGIDLILIGWTWVMLSLASKNR